MKILQRFCSDETGFIIASELVLVATILVIGFIVGLVSLRNQVVQELIDLGQAIGSLDQSYACGTGKNNGSLAAGSVGQSWNNAGQSWNSGSQGSGAISVYQWSPNGLQ